MHLSGSSLHPTFPCWASVLTFSLPEHVLPKCFRSSSSLCRSLPPVLYKFPCLSSCCFCCGTLLSTSFSTPLPASFISLSLPLFLCLSCIFNAFETFKSLPVWRGLTVKQLNSVCGRATQEMWRMFGRRRLHNDEETNKK